MALIWMEGVMQKAQKGLTRADDPAAKLIGKKLGSYFSPFVFSYLESSFTIFGITLILYVDYRQMESIKILFLC
jgi:hypothetical protein